MFKPPFVVLDLETSGADPKKDDIIEVAMVRYENGKEVGRFNELIRIDTPLPKIITLITHITDQELQEHGKDSAEVFKEITKMLKGAYLICHNVAFDHGFLKAKGVKMELLGLMDTIPLAQILLPQATSYSLESLTVDLGIEHLHKHRAMGDVEATLELFKRLWEMGEALPSSAVQEIQRYLPQSTWGGGIFFEELKGTNQPVVGPVVGPMVGPIEGVRRALSVEEILGEDGILRKHWEQYEPRPQQVQMAKAVSGAFENGYHLICEAPTGVGKSLAYLISAAATAIQNKSKVVISTNTINLQDQLYEKDIPMLQEIYRQGTQNAGFRAALLKGRNHYLCLRRLAKFKESSRFSDPEIILLVKILVWQKTTKTGDCGEIHLTRDESMIWDFELCADSKYCTPQKCRTFGECYLQRARRLAEEADVIVVNHALLNSDLKSEGSLLPEYQYLIVDEAHNFEEAATDAFGQSLKQENFSLPFRVIRLHLEDIQRRYEGTLFGGEMAMRLLGGVLESLKDLEGRVDNLFTLVAYFVNQNVQASGYVESLLVDPTVQGMEEWLNLAVSADETSASIKDWLQELRTFAEALMLGSNDEASEQNMLAGEILQECDLLAEQTLSLKAFFSEDPSLQHIRWLTSDQQGVVGLNLAPYLPGTHLKEKLYTKKKSIVLTSATLGIKLHDKSFDAPEQHPFNYLRTILSLDEHFEELIIDSPFDYEKQAYVMIPKDVLPVTSPRSPGQLVTFFENLLKSVGGNTLSLFTSYRMIETLYMALVEPLQNAGIRLLAQRISGGRNKILKAYLADPAHSALFGTSSFWEGVDIRGEALSTLIIHKLPFDMPNDPIHKARSQLFENGFMEYTVPRAILKFRQGFGRLIRSTTDYGVMMVLDERLYSKKYGEFFLQALPDGITVEQLNLDQIPAKAKEWLELSKSNR
jgi:predicted DnaQ family exonuclease/DinG family helicase